ncbi:hypothetical protein PsYK624_085430 [Phanerochaete sordida]|uniref:Uncharacterized protein n=1 Tax=Phanerochaete sordida TaxID=48140 RepID=A0A9P3GER0_9APHY|nr:hypothetical protein PsYK624_085430 [Phanerochaete sordida]
MSSTGSLDSVAGALAASSSSSASARSGSASASSAASSSSSVSSSSAASSLSSSTSSSSESSSPSSAAASTSFSATLTSSSLSFTTSPSAISQAPAEPSSAFSAPLDSTPGPSQASPSVVTSGTPSDSFDNSLNTPSPTAPTSASLSPQGAPASTWNAASPSTLEAVQHPSLSSSSSSLSQDDVLASQPAGQTTRSFKTTFTARPSADWRNAQSASRGGSSSFWSTDGDDGAGPSSTAELGGALQVSSSQDSPTPMAVGANPTSTLVYTAVWQTTLASNSGTATSGQVVDVTQVTTRGYGSTDTLSSLPSDTTAGAGASSASSGHGTNALVVILVPILVVGALLVPCILLLLRIRRRRQVRFMSTYEDLTGHRASGTYTDSLARDSESPFPYDMASIPSASMVHRDMASRGSSRAQTARGASPADDPFADAPEDAHAPLFAEYAHARSDSAAPRTRSPSAASSRPGSRWGTLTPMSRGVYSPAPTDSRAGSRSANRSVDLATPFEWDGMEDPFADPNRHAD